MAKQEVEIMETPHSKGWICPECKKSNRMPGAKVRNNYACSCGYGKVKKKAEDINAIPPRATRIIIEDNKKN